MEATDCEAGPPVDTTVGSRLLEIEEPLVSVELGVSGLILVEEATAEVGIVRKEFDKLEDGFGS